MALKNQDYPGGGNGKYSSVNYSTSAYFNAISSPSRSSSMINGKRSPRLSPNRVPTPPGSQGSSPRTSPGLLAGHYAGCKWTEPPLPSSLPLPPMHWMQGIPMSCAIENEKSNYKDMTHQLKVLLNVQA